MAKVYGGRWQLTDAPPLGEGGQSKVFRTIDTTGQLRGEFALKRVISPKRHDRFLRETEAIKRLTHPNIIKLIDHSALDDADTTEEKQFIVMPIAEGGDLSTPGRLALYKNSIDAVIQVAKQVAAALVLAHSNAIIHRDVKPQNILFTGMGHDVWLTDFGICLIREQPRVTETPEVVGPRAFLAPELEDGGQLDVTPAADIYSLGKVIYYMLSGGVIVPRERLHEEKYRQIFSSGERYHLLELLLRKMVSPIASRIQDMNSVIRELEKIAAWEQNARLLAISPDGLAGLEQWQRRSLETARVLTENANARQQEADTVAKVKETLLGWLDAELKKVAAQINSNSTLKAEVRKAQPPNGQPFHIGTGHHSAYTTLDGIELVVEDVGARSGRKHALQLYFCTHHGALVVVRASVGPPKPEVVAAEPARDLDLGVIAIYREVLNHQHPGMSSALGYISAKAAIGTNRTFVDMPGPPQVRARQMGHRIAPQQRFMRIEQMMPSFGKDYSQHFPFKASEWPANEDQLRGMLTDAIDTFIAIVNSGG